MLHYILAFLLSLPFRCASEEATKPQAGIDIADISYSSLGPAAQKLLDARENKLPEVTLHFDSPGGDIGAMLAFSALMRHVELGGTKVTCVVDGMAASAGLYVLEVCSERVAYPNSIFLAHEVSVSVDGLKPTELDKLAEMARAFSRIYLAQISARSNKSLAWWLKQIDGRDYWFGAEEALSLGSVDQIKPMPY